MLIKLLGMVDWEISRTLRRNGHRNLAADRMSVEKREGRGPRAASSEGRTGGFECSGERDSG